MSGLCGAVIIGILQIEEHFSEEEFFAGLQFIIISILCFIITQLNSYWPNNRITWHQTNHNRHVVVGLCILLVTSIYLYGSIRAYQLSFYPVEAPSYKGITADSPFLCGLAPQSKEKFQGETVYEDLIALVAANPDKSSREFGLLALVDPGHGWEEQFRQSLLSDAHQQLYTQPANSVKYYQCLAARSAYFYGLVKNKYPNLFTHQEQIEIAKWFADINKRAQTIEWIDWIYGLALNKRPSGPYENQECGAGLIAVLEHFELADPSLSSLNQEYLANNPRGWQERFRNTDDSYVYQTEWLHHAWFQFLYTGRTNPDLQQLSFEWFLLQSLPDGSFLQYNNISGAAPAQTAFWASNILNGTKPPRSIQVEPGQALWLAGRSSEYLTSQKLFLFAQPGMEKRNENTGFSPSFGSCLLYGDSGLPNQIGPLAPDKIVFRDNWENDSKYLILNLRFTGWHRYKATNSIALFYRNGPIIGDLNAISFLSWLPEGRSLVRDKRIPRENLNGLVVERTALSAIIHYLTNIGGTWAQDPPYYATVKEFKTGEDIDFSTTVLDDWRGWKQTRTIYFNHNGPVIIRDEVAGPDDKNAALTWHMIGQARQNHENRIEIRNGSGRVEMLFISEYGNANLQDINIEWDPDTEYTNILYQSGQKGGFSVFTILLTEDWLGANASIVHESQSDFLKLNTQGKSIEIKID
jgi:hypothetical protein